jgi:hypothetical protein
MDKSTPSYFRKCYIIVGKIDDENAFPFKKKSERNKINFYMPSPHFHLDFPDKKFLSSNL